MTGIDPTARSRLGHTALHLSRLGVGGGSSFVRAGAAGGAGLIETAWNAGLRYFDTAPLYGEGESERRYGSALAARPRDAFVLSTKVGRNAATTFDYSAAGVTASLNRSRERLGIERIDIALIHDLDRDMHGERFEARFEEALTGAYPTLAAMRAAGTLGAIGVGTKDWDVALRVLRAGQFDCVMLAGGYTLLQHGGGAELLPYCVANGIGVIVAAPFNTGILATGAIEGARYYYKPAPEPILARVLAIEQVCKRYAIPLAAAALQFPLTHRGVCAVVAGHEAAHELERNVALTRVAIPPAFWAELVARELIPGNMSS